MSLPSRQSSPEVTLSPGITMRFYITPSHPESSPYKRYTEVTCDPSVPGFKPLSVPPHWHTDHDEHMSVLEGELEVTLGYGRDKKVVMLRPGMETVVLPRREVHAIRSKEGVRTVLREGNTFGSQRNKEKFFRHMTDKTAAAEVFLLGRALWESNTYISMPILGFRSEMLEIFVTTLLGGLPWLTGLAPPPPELPNETEFMQKKQ